MPAVSPPIAAVTVSVPLPVPDAELRLSQLALSLAVHTNVPPPVLLMLNVWVAGLFPPCVAVNERLVGLVPIAGGTAAADTVNVTGMVTAVVPGADIETVAL